MGSSYRHRSRNLASEIVARKKCDSSVSNDQEKIDNYYQNTANLKLHEAQQ